MKTLKEYRGFAIMFAFLTAMVVMMMMFTGCEMDDQPVEGKQKDDVQKDPKCAVDIDMKTTHMDGFDLLTTTKTIHDEFGNVVRVVTSYDTLPKLSMVRDTLETGRTYEDDNGDEKSIDTIIFHPKDYQYYISVKK